MIRRALVALGGACFVLSCVVAIASAAGGWRISSVPAAGAHVSIERDSLVQLVPVRASHVRAGDVLAMQWQGKRLMRVDAVADGAHGGVRLAGVAQAQQLAATVWRVRHVVPFVGVPLRLVGWPGLVVVALALGLLVAVPRLRRLVQRRPRGFAVALGTAFMLMASAADASFTATASDTLVVGSGGNPNPPTSLACSWTANATVQTTWTASTTYGTAGYEVQRGTSSGGESNLADAGNVTSYSDATVNPSGSEPQTATGPYYYRAYAYRGDGSSWKSSNSSEVHTDTCSGYMTAISGRDEALMSATAMWPVGVTVPTTGTAQVYEVDKQNLIRRSGTGGVITSSAYVGSWASGYFGDSGPADIAAMNSPTKIVRDSTGILYISDTTNNVIRKVDASGIITTIAGTGSAGTGSDATAQTATTIALKTPRGLALDGDTTLYVADSGNNRIQKIDLSVSPATIINYAGSNAGTSGSSDNATGTSATFKTPWGLAVDTSTHTLYVADSANKTIRQVASAAPNAVTRIAGTVATSSEYGGDTGAATSGNLDAPVGLYWDATNSALIIGDRTENKIRKVDSNTKLQAVAGVPLGLSGSTGDDGAATSARLSGPTYTVEDSKGNVYFSDSANNKIRVIDSSGKISTYAGTGTASESGDGGPATAATFNNPTGLAIDSKDNIYVADTGNDVIRKISATGIVTLFTGVSGTAGHCNDATPHLDLPRGLSYDGSHNRLYIANAGDNTICRVVVRTLATLQGSANTLTLLAGSTTGASGNADNATLTSATFNNPRGIAYVDDSHIYVADTTNNRIRLVSLTGGVSAYAGDAAGGTSGSTCSNTAAASARFNAPENVAWDATNSRLFVADTGNKVIRYIDSTPNCQVFAGNAGTGGSFAGDGGSATSSSAALESPEGLVWDSTDSWLYVADAGDNLIRKVIPAGNISTYAGDGVAGFAGDNGAGTSAELSAPQDVAWQSSNGTIYIADTGNKRLRKLTSGGATMTTFGGNGTRAYSADGQDAGTTQFDETRGLARCTASNGVAPVACANANDMYVADSVSGYIRKISGADNTVSTIAGNGGSQTYAGDTGDRASASFTNAVDFAQDSKGNIYVVDKDANRVRKISRAGYVTTFAGTGMACSSATSSACQNSTATSAQLNAPDGIAVDGSDNVYIADTGDNKIVKVTSSGTLSLYAGTGDAAHLDASPLTSAKINAPRGLFIDTTNNLMYIAESGSNYIRKIDIGGASISTFAGSGSTCPAGTGQTCDDGGAPTDAAAKFNNPARITGDPNGGGTGSNALYISDQGDNKIRKIASSVLSTVVGTGGTCNAGGTCGDGAAATSATLDAPIGIGYDTQHFDVVIADSGSNRVRYFDGTNINWYSGSTTGTAGTSPTGNGAVNDSTSRYTTPTGIFVGTTAIVTNATSTLRYVLVGAADHYIRRLTDEPKWDASGNQYQYVWMWGGNGSSATLNLGSNGATATSVQLNFPEGMWLDTTHNALYVAGDGNNVIRKIDLSVATPTISTVAGTGVACTPATASCGDGGAATSAQLNQPTGITGDASTNPPTLYIADYGDNKIRKVDSSGNISTIAGDGTAATTSGSGVAANAELDGPYGITLSGSNLYFTENTGHVVRKITVGNGAISTVAGTADAGCASITNACGDGAAATGATLYFPTTVIVDSSNRILVSDWSDGRVRRFADGGNISTIVGGGGGSIGGLGGAFGYRGDYGGAIGAYADPGGLALGSDGSLYVGTGGLVATSIYGNGFRIRKVYVP